MRLFDIVMALCTAADLVSPAVANHHKRVAFIALSIAEELGWSSAECHELVIAAALHDIGAFSLSERLNLLNFDDDGTMRHAELGYMFLSHFAPFANIAQIVRYHHQPWEHGDGMSVDGQNVPAASHVLHLADRVDVLVDQQKQVLGQSERICARIEKARGSLFASPYIDAFLKIAGYEYFWLDIASPRLDGVLAHKISQASFELSLEALADLAKLFSHIIDFKSPFTSTHSTGVATTAEALADLVGFSSVDRLQIRIAGYLHDLGKLAVAVEILEKPGSLTENEMNAIRSHTYYTRRILEGIPELSKITGWAASHHEHLDGRGYPFHLGAADLPLGARIIAVADVFTALAEPRPYRDGLSRELVLPIMRKMVEDGKLDNTLVHLLDVYYDDMDRRRAAAQAEAQAEYRQMVTA